MKHSTAISNWGLFPSLATSALVHGVIFGVGFLGLRWAHQSVAFDAVEVTLGDFSIQKGAVHSSPAPSVVAPQASPLDLAVPDKKETAKPEPVESEIARAAVQIGEGGESAASQGGAASAWDAYRGRVHQRIHEALLYPRVSKNLNETGRVKVKLTVLRDGTISKVDIAEPSAFDRLNVAAMDTVKRVARLDPLPQSYLDSQWDATIPIDFHLR